MSAPMTDDEILEAADRILRRRELVEKMDVEFKKTCQLVSFDDNGESARFWVDETIKGFIRSHLLAEFDRSYEEKK